MSQDNQMKTGNQMTKGLVRKLSRFRLKKRQLEMTWHHVLLLSLSYPDLVSFRIFFVIILSRLVRDDDAASLMRHWIHSSSFFSVRVPFVSKGLTCSLFFGNTFVVSCRFLFASYTLVFHSDCHYFSLSHLQEVKGILGLKRTASLLTDSWTRIFEELLFSSTVTLHSRGFTASSNLSLNSFFSHRLWTASSEIKSCI